MIRLANVEDLLYIDKIGTQISECFCNKNQIKESLNSEYTKIYVYEDEGIVKGFLHIEDHYEITDIINIAVSDKYQKLGIGKQLIDYVINTTSSEKIMLEVRETNVRAISFYHKCGFVEIHRRVNYYGNEDAIIMERSI